MSDDLLERARFVVQLFRECDAIQLPHGPTEQVLTEMINRIKELEAEKKRLGQQCEGLIQAAVSNNRALILAEAKLAQKDDLVQAAVLALMGYDAKGAGAKDACEGFDLAISMALAAIREGGE